MQPADHQCIAMEVFCHDMPGIESSPLTPNPPAQRIKGVVAGLLFFWAAENLSGIDN
jgi:hypothetical protein